MRTLEFLKESASRLRIAFDESWQAIGPRGKESAGSRADSGSESEASEAEREFGELTGIRLSSIRAKKFAYALPNRIVVMFGEALSRVGRQASQKIIRSDRHAHREDQPSGLSVGKFLQHLDESFLFVANFLEVGLHEVVVSDRGYRG